MPMMKDAAGANGLLGTATVAMRARLFPAPADPTTSSTGGWASTIADKRCALANLSPP